MKPPTLFERDVALDGKLRLPSYLFDEYQECVISLGIHSRHYLQLMNDGVYLMFWKGLEEHNGEWPILFDEDLADRSDRLATAVKLKLDDIGRIQIPLDILHEASIKPGGSIIGRASWVPGYVNPHQPQAQVTPHPTYWRIMDKHMWLSQNPSGEYSLDLARARFND